MRYANGTPGWVDLSTTDTERARLFYTQFFGWTAMDMPTPEGIPYTQFFKAGKVVAGMAPQPPNLAALGVPSMWNTYIMVESVDATVAAAEEAGGTALMPAMDVMTAGRMAMVADPSGAVIGLWQPRAHEGADVLKEPGSLAWSELDTRDLAAATPFYSQVFGWRWESDESGYQVAHRGVEGVSDEAVAGAMTMPPMAPPEAPSCWMVYFAVEDCQSAVAAATDSGGTVFLPPTAIPPGEFAGIVDPTGAMFLVCRFEDI